MNMPSIGNLSDMGMNPSDMLKELDGKIHYPATKDQIVSAINDIPDIPQAAKQLVANKLPEGSYKSVDDIKNAVHF